MRDWEIERVHGIIGWAENKLEHSTVATSHRGDAMLDRIRQMTHRTGFDLDGLEMTFANVYENLISTSQKQNNQSYRECTRNLIL